MRGAIASAALVLGGLLASTAAAQTVENGANLGSPPENGPSGDGSSAPADPAVSPQEPEASAANDRDPNPPRPESPRLVVLASDETSTAGLVGMLRTQLPGWQVERQDEPAGMLAIERLRGELRARDALLWLEAGDAVVHVVIQGPEGRALASPIPTDAAGDDRSRVYALAAVGLLTELSERRLRMAAYEESVLHIRERQLDQLRERREEDAERIEGLTRAQHLLRAELATLRTRPRSRWRSPIASSGWFVRLGWVQGLSPGHDYGRWSSDPNPTLFPHATGGVRASVGHRFADRFQVGGALVTLHAPGLWNGSLSAFASVHSRTRFRVGVSGEVGLLVSKESDDYSGAEVSWGSARFYLPLELGIVTHEHGGVFLKLGPLVTRAPSAWFVGYDMSVEWEFD